LQLSNNDCEYRYRESYVHYTGFVIKTNEQLPDWSEYDLEPLNYEVTFLCLSGWVDYFFELIFKVYSQSLKRQRRHFYYKTLIILLLLYFRRPDEFRPLLWWDKIAINIIITLFVSGSLKNTYFFPRQFAAYVMNVIFSQSVIILHKYYYKCGLGDVRTFVLSCAPPPPPPTPPTLSPTTNFTRTATEGQYPNFKPVITIYIMCYVYVLYYYVFIYI